MAFCAFCAWDTVGYSNGVLCVLCAISTMPDKVGRGGLLLKHDQRPTTNDQPRDIKKNLIKNLAYVKSC